jgi:hypothetical protein
MRTCALLAILLASGLMGQHNRVDSRNTDHRVLCVVPMVGQGTPADPKRPQYAPWPPTPNASRTAIVSYSHQVSDDGRFALVEFVARDRQAFDAIFKDKSVKVFEKGKDKKEDIDKELKKFKKDFDLEKFGAVRP